MKQVSIMELMAWAFREELPKVERASSFAVAGSVSSTAAMIAQVGELGTLVDIPVNQWGVVPVMVDDEPHPDAVRVGEAVRAVGKMQLTLPADWTPFPEWNDEDGLIAKAVAAEMPRLIAGAARQAVADLVSTAVTGHCPDWSIGVEPRRRMITRAGKPAWFVEASGMSGDGVAWSMETNGYDQRRKRPKPGSYRKFELSRSIAGDLAGRCRFTMWATGVQAVATRLLEYHDFSAAIDDIPIKSPWFN